MKENLLLLHGALGSKQDFKALKTKLSMHFEVYTLDFEGHGDYLSNADFSMDVFVQNIVSYLKKKHLNSICIFGYSMGGYVALNMARQYPELVGKIVTLGTKFDWTKASAEKEVKMLDPDKMELKVPAFANQLALIHGANWKIMVRKTAQMILRLGSGEALTHQQMKCIQHPILIGVGDQDQMVSIEESKASSTYLPKGSLKVFENFKHHIKGVDETRLSLTIISFIENH